MIQRVVVDHLESGIQVQCRAALRAIVYQLLTGRIECGADPRPSKLVRDSATSLVNERTGSPTGVEHKQDS